MPRLLPFILILLSLTTVSHAAVDRTLTFEERVLAQEKIERFYYEHRIGSKLPFEEVVTREVLERKVHDYLKRSVALEQLWDQPVTADALSRETQRIIHDTRKPARLLELFAALDDDSFVIQECLARPALVVRLTRDLFAYDEEIHSATRTAATQISEQSAQGGRSRQTLSGHQVVVEWVRSAEPESIGLDLFEGGVRRIVLAPREHAKRRALLPRDSSEPGEIEETYGSFIVRVLRAENKEEGRVRFERYAIRKVQWDEWWAEVALTLDDRSLLPLTDLAQLSLEFDPVALTDAPDSSEFDLVYWDNGALAPAQTPEYAKGESVWTGSELIVWGGEVSYNPPAGQEGGRYDPVLDNWTPTATVGAAEARDYHSLVWTGNEVIMWGGRYYLGDAQYAFRSGGRYSPALDQWTSISISGSPISGNWSHTAVWTGNEMIVYGGIHLSRDTFCLPCGLCWYPADHGIYRPSTDSWSPLETSSSPGERWDHTAVWTGEEMIVWGGALQWVEYGDPSICHWDTFDDGAVYNPVSEQWSPMTATAAPSSRRYHSAIWTGDEMIVWGGEGTAELQTGGIYHLSTNSWAPISTIDAPSARTRHSAVWTGDWMVVWGGDDLNTGAAFDPGLDQWIGDTPSADAPVGAEAPRGAWTGSEVLVYGTRNDTWGGRLVLDTDYDRDGIHNTVDNCPNVPNPDQADCDENGIGDLCDAASDCDGDGIYNPADNCPYIPTLDQTDTDNDGRGDVCDLDDDGDLVLDDGDKSGTAGDNPCETGEILNCDDNCILDENGEVLVWLDSSFEIDDEGWTHTSVAGADTWHRADTTCAGGPLPGTMLLSNGNHGPACVASSSHESSMLISPAVQLSSVGRAYLTFDALSYDEAGECSTLFTQLDWHDVGVTTDDGATYEILNDCYSLTDGAGTSIHHEFDLSAYLGQQIRIVFVYDTVDFINGHTFAVDNVRVASATQDGVAQADGDMDGSGDICDCAPEDPVLVEPVEITGLILDRSGTVGEATITWTPLGGSATYAITRGDLDSLTAGQYGSCLIAGIVGSEFEDSEAPDTGGGYLYLVQPELGDCSSLGSSAGGERLNLDPGACAP